MRSHPRTKIERARLRCESGVALIAVILILALVAGGALMAALGSSPRAEIAAQRDEARALALAKRALLAYGLQASVPVTANRPGSLPCPDLNNDGQSSGSCTEADTLGWFPFRTLDLPDLRDASNSRLWYAVSKEFRSSVATARNSDTPGTLSLDGSGDVVAVIIAPGAALDGQDRTEPSAGFDATTQRRAFLEDANSAEPTDPAYEIYVSRPGTSDPFNDRVVSITRTELMRKVEQRVVGEVAATLRAYSDSWDGGPAARFPWFVQFSDPQGLSDFHGVPGTREGLVPMHEPGGADEQFVTPWTITWSNLTPLPPPEDVSGTVTADDFDSSPPGGLSIPEAGASCSEVGASCCWWFAGQPGRARCTGTVSVPLNLGLGEYLGDPILASTRTYSFVNISVTADPPDVTVVAPTDTEVRTRGVIVTPTSGTIESGGEFSIQDEVTVDQGGIAVTLVVGFGSLTLDSTSSADNITLAGMRYWLNPGAELPAWFAANNWHHLVYVVASPAYQANGGQDCIAASNCLTLLVNGTPVPADIGLAVLAAGAPISLLMQNRSGGGGLSDYLEEENQIDGDGQVTRNTYRLNSAPAFNDQIRVLIHGSLL